MPLNVVNYEITKRLFMISQTREYLLSFDLCFNPEYTGYNGDGLGVLVLSNTAKGSKQ